MLISICLVLVPPFLTLLLLDRMRGVTSQAMVMCSGHEKLFEVLDPPEGCVPGERVTFEGYPGDPDSQLNPKKKVNCN